MVLQVIKWSYAIKVLPNLLRGTVITIKLALLGVIAGIIIGTIVGLIRVNRTKILYQLATVYVEVIRGTPMLVQLVLFFYGLPQIIGYRMEPLRRLLLPLVSTVGLYFGDCPGDSIHRPGQMEAARPWVCLTFRPCGILFCPSLSPHLAAWAMSLYPFEGYGLASTVTLQEMMRWARFRWPAPGSPSVYVMAALIYLVMTLPLSQGVRWLERRMGAGDQGL